MHENDQKSLIWEKQEGQNVPKSSFNQEMKGKKKKRKKKPAMLKTQKGGLGKS